MNPFTHSISRLFLIFLLGNLNAWSQVTIDPPTRSFTKDGGGGSVLTSGTGTWTATTISSWINITPRTTGSAGTSCIYVVSANLSADARQGVINIAGTTHTITQLGYTATLSPTSATVNLAGGARTVSITTSAGVSWTATTSTPWITVNSPSGVGSGTATYTVANYSGVVTRTGSILIGGQTFSVSQTGTDVNISPYSSDKAYSSDIVTVDVAALSATNWNVTSNASWISVVDPGAKKGNSTVFLAIGTNPSYVERSGTVTIGSATFTVRQSGTPNPQLDILPKTATAEPTGAFANIAVIATPDAPWTAESLTPWIIASGTSGAGNGNIGYVASANPTLSPRTGTVRVYAPAVLPKTDLTQALLAHIPTGSLDQSGWGHHLAGPIETRFDGSFRRELFAPQDIKLDVDAGSLAIRFRVENLGAIHRLVGISANGTDTGFYVNAANRVAFQSGSTTLVSDFTIEANKEYHAVVTVSPTNEVKIYAGEVSTQIRLAGTQTFASAPIRLSVPTTPASIKIGYAEIPSAGYLSGGVIKDFRLYGRALTTDEVAVLFASALSATPYGPPETSAVPPVTYYNLRGQAVFTSGSQPPTANTTTIHTLRGAWSSGTSRVAETSSWQEVHNGTFIDRIGTPIIITVSNRVYAGGTQSWGYYGGQQQVYAKAVYTYEDNTSSETAEQSLSNTKNNSSGASTTSATFTFTSPRASEWTKSVKILTRYVRTNVGQYNTSYWATHSYEFNSFTATIPTLAERAVSLASKFYEASDRFSVKQRAIKGTTQSALILSNQQSSFTGTSATYSFWLRLDALPTGDTRWRLFKRSGLISQELNVYLDAAGNFSCDNGTLSVPISAGIKAKQWQMLTFTGATGGTTTVYVDGAEVGNTNAFGDYNFGKANTDPILMRIGGWNGGLSSLGFYDGALTSTQVKQIYDEQKMTFIDHVVTQGVVTPELSPSTATLAAEGGSTTSQLTLASNVSWTAQSSAAWLQITSNTSGSGSTTLQVFAAANPTVTTRTATVTIAGKQFTVSQAGMPASVSFTPQIFTTDGGSMMIDVTAGGDAQWEATSNASWLTVALGETGSGNGFVFLIADPYNNTSQSRTGSVTIAGRTLYFTQRGYNLSITPQVAEIGSNSGAGEFGVAAPLSAVWEAIVTQPWITVLGSTTGIGNGTLRYTVAANDTGATRSGKIIVSGQEYTITQTTSLLLNADDDGNGTVSGDGSYSVNASATLTATPSAGYVFSHWTGDAVGSANPLTLAMDSSKTVKAHFLPAAAANVLATNTAASLGLVPSSRVNEARQAALAEVAANPNSFGYYNPSQIQGMALGRPLLAKDPSTGKMKLSLGLKKSTDLKEWQGMNVASGDVSVTSGKLDIKITPQEDAAFYILEGSEGE
jgi:hypothetical protein